MFTSTPTAFTTSSTFSSSFSFRNFWSTSCWYCPTPIALGSIFVSSANGSWTLWAILIAPLIVTSRSGYSSWANLEAEYTEAQASEVMMYWVFRSFFLIKSATTFSDSLLAVQFPITISWIQNFFTNSNSVFSASAIFFWGSVG